jgi:hypothetical protein
MKRMAVCRVYVTTGHYFLKACPDVLGCQMVIEGDISRLVFGRFNFWPFGGHICFKMELFFSSRGHIFYCPKWTCKYPQFDLFLEIGLLHKVTSHSEEKAAYSGANGLLCKHYG